MTEPVEKKRKFIITVAYWAVIFAIVYFVIKKALIVFLPFVIAFAISACLQPLIRRISERFSIKQRKASAIVVVLFYCTVGVLVSLLVFKLSVLIFDSITNLPQYYSRTILPFVENTLSQIQDKLRTFDEDITLEISTVMTWLAGRLQEMTELVDKAILFITEIPSVLVTVLITVVSTFFISADYVDINTWCLAQLSEKNRNTVLDIRQYVTQILFKYIRSYALILLITFTELFIALSTAGLIFPDMFSGLGQIAVIAGIIAVFDILPIVGTGTVLIPWGVIQLVTGNIWQGIVLLIIYVIIMVVRQIIEPKIVGGQVGLHPVVTLIGMIVGTALFGVLGLFGLPITFALLNDLNRRGKIHLFKSVKK